MLSADAIDRLLWVGGAWLLLAAAWAAACMWVETDADRIFGKSMPWSMAFVAPLGLMGLVTFQYGFGAMPLFMLLFPAELAGYVFYRDKQAPETERILSRRFAQKMLMMAARKLGVEESLQKLVAETPAVLKPEKQLPSVVLLKKDGSPIEGQGASGMDRDASKAVKVIRDLFGKAIALGATDLHFEPKSGEEMNVRCRVDGIMQNLAVLWAAEGKASISALKVLADMDIAERRRPQDGTFAVLCKTRKFDIRAASGPTNFGEKMSLRLLDSDGAIVKGGLEGIGMSPSVVKTMRQIIHQPHGMLIVCGPTGSGKTTTLYTALGEIDAFSRNILTIEDPIEYRLENISQTAVNNAAGLTFASILRSMLRQDPDVILVGEVRDKETAEIAMQAALTGHFVFTTIHANDTATTVTRLLDIGIDTNLIQSALTAVLAQRLVRKLCERCKEPYSPPAEFLQKLGLPTDRQITLYKEVGCASCHKTGYKGRTGVHELLVIDKTIRELLVGSPSIEQIRSAAKKSGMKTLKQSGLAKAIAGVTSLNEVMRVTK
jgi:general secretion pathway protein E